MSPGVGVTVVRAEPRLVLRELLLPRGLVRSAWASPGKDLALWRLPGAASGSSAQGLVRGRPLAQAEGILQVSLQTLPPARSPEVREDLRWEERFSWKRNLLSLSRASPCRPTRPPSSSPSPDPTPPPEPQQPLSGRVPPPPSSAAFHKPLFLEEGGSERLRSQSCPFCARFRPPPPPPSPGCPLRCGGPEASTNLVDPV